MFLQTKRRLGEPTCAKGAGRCEGEARVVFFMVFFLVSCLIEREESKRNLLSLASFIFTFFCLFFFLLSCWQSMGYETKARARVFWCLSFFLFFYPLFLPPLGLCWFLFFRCFPPHSPPLGSLAVPFPWFGLSCLVWPVLWPVLAVFLVFPWLGLAWLYGGSGLTRRE